MKSSFSFSNGNRVEAASPYYSGVGVRDSKDAEGPILRFTASEWRAFLSGQRGGASDGR